MCVLRGTPLNLTATELLGKLAQLIPPPRRHRHHYHGVLAPNSKYRSRVTQFANQEFSPVKSSSLAENEVDDDILFAPKENSVLQIKKSSVASLPGWDSLMGLQFENLIYNKEMLIFKELGLTMNEIVFANPYFQTSTKDRKGCQFDYILQTKYNNVYIIEIKFSKNKVGTSVIEEVQEKIKRLKLPRNFSYRPVLIHVNGVTQDLLDMRYFSKVIDFSKFLVSD